MLGESKEGFMYRIVLIVALCVFVAATAYADIDEAFSAIDKGNYAEGFRLFRECAERGDAEAQYMLGEMYYDGKGVDQDDQQSVQWTRKAAENGLTEAEVFLGYL